MVDLEQIVKDSFEKIKNNGIIEQKVEAVITKTVEDIIEDALREYSDFGKQLKTTVSQSLNINFKELTIPEYNQLILDQISKKVDEVMLNFGVEQMKKDIQEMLVGTQRDWKLSELVEELKNFYADDARENDWDEMSLHLDKGSLTFIYIDPEPEKSNWACRICITVCNDGSISSVELDGTKKKEGLVLGRLYGIEKTLFRLYAQHSKLIIDEDRVDTYYNRDDD